MKTKERTIQDLKKVYIYDLKDFFEQVHNHIDNLDHPEASDSFIWESLPKQVRYTIDKAELYGNSSILGWEEDRDWAQVVKRIWQNGLRHWGIVSREYLMQQVRPDDEYHHELLEPYYYYAASYFNPTPVRHHDAISLAHYLIPRLSILNYLIDIAYRASNLNKYQLDYKGPQEPHMLQGMLDVRFVQYELAPFFDASVVKARKDWGAHNFTSREAMLRELYRLKDRSGADSASLVAQRIRYVRSQDDTLYNNKMGVMFAQPIDSYDWTNLLSYLSDDIINIIV